MVIHLKVEIGSCVFSFVILSVFHTCCPRCSSKPKKKNIVGCFGRRNLAVTSSVTPTVPRIM